MKKNRFLLITLLTVGLMALSGCSLFDDSDIAIKNSYNPHDATPEPAEGTVVASGVAGQEIEAVPNALCFKNISYVEEGSIITNTYKAGGVNANEYHVNGDLDYPTTTSSNTYDLYVPNDCPRNDEHTVILFVHGGAWISGFKTDVNPYIFDFANRGYIAATIKYTLLKRSMDDPTLSIFRNLDEIDACIKSIKTSLQELGFDVSKTNLVIGGASSGAHLSMLYSYSRGDKCPLPLRFVIDAVGPVDIDPYNWKSFVNPTDEALDGQLTHSSIEAQRSASNLAELSIAGDSAHQTWNNYQTMKIANGMCGMPYSLETVRAATNEEEKVIVDPSNEAYVSMTKDGGGQDLLSVTYWMKHTTNRFKIICAYSGMDTIVGVAQYAKLEETLDSPSIEIEHEYFYFRNCGHTNIDSDAEKYSAFVTQIDNWGKAL